MTEELARATQAACIERPVKEGTAQNGRPKDIGRKHDGWSNGARVGIAFNVCYLNWLSNGVNIFGHREQFIRNVLDTYQLLTEIAEKAEAV